MEGPPTPFALSIRKVIDFFDDFGSSPSLTGNIHKNCETIMQFYSGLTQFDLVYTLCVLLRN